MTEELKQIKLTIFQNDETKSTISASGEKNRLCFHKLSMKVLFAFLLCFCCKEIPDYRRSITSPPVTSRRHPQSN